MKAETAIQKIRSLKLELNADEAFFLLSMLNVTNDQARNLCAQTIEHLYGYDECLDPEQLIAKNLKREKMNAFIHNEFVFEFFNKLATFWAEEDEDN